MQGSLHPRLPSHLALTLTLRVSRQCPALSLWLLHVASGLHRQVQEKTLNQRQKRCVCVCVLRGWVRAPGPPCCPAPLLEGPSWAIFTSRHLSAAEKSALPSFLWALISELTMLSGLALGVVSPLLCTCICAGGMGPRVYMCRYVCMCV